ncbi:MAG: hypothetical protein HWN68_11835 [Desulfobacterales bacterium]|nr:hypothetical protein [Desulfobacterales bacterium]
MGEPLFKVTDIVERRRVTPGGRIQKYYEVHFTTLHGGSATVEVSEADFVADKVADAIMPLAETIEAMLTPVKIE